MKQLRGRNLVENRDEGIGNGMKKQERSSTLLPGINYRPVSLIALNRFSFDDAVCRDIVDPETAQAVACVSKTRKERERIRRSLLRIDRSV